MISLTAFPMVQHGCQMQSRILTVGRVCPTEIQPIFNTDSSD